MKIRWCVLLIALLASQGVNADAKVPSDASAPAHSNDPNDPSATAGRTASEDPNDPNDPSATAGRTACEDPNDPNDPSVTAGRTACEDPNDPSATAGRTASEDPNDPNDPSATAGRTAANDPNDPNQVLWKKWDVVIKKPNDPNDVLWTKWCAVVKVLQAKQLDKEVKAKIIDKIITPIFDFPVMAQLVVRKHWSKFTPSQRERFTKLFTKRLKTSYRDKISLYTDETASLKPAQPKKKTIIYIPMEMISNDKKIEILYKLRKNDKHWKIYDVEVQGISIIWTYIAQFNDILRKGDVEKLISQMEKPQKR